MGSTAGLGYSATSPSLWAVGPGMRIISGGKKVVRSLRQITIGNHNIKLMSSEGLYALQQKISHHLKHCFWHSTGPDADPRTPHDQVARNACPTWSEPKTIYCKMKVLHFWPRTSKAGGWSSVEQMDRIPMNPPTTVIPVPHFLAHMEAYMWLTVLISWSRRKRTCLVHSSICECMLKTDCYSINQLP